MLINHIRKVAGFTQNQAMILLYHRIAIVDCDPQLLCVTLEHFEEHLQKLRNRYELICLHELGKSVAERSVPKNAIAVSFDDGFVDNLNIALPLLKKYEIPATVFVTSGYVDQDRELPSDTLERCLLGDRHLPEKPTLRIGDQSRTWEIGKNGGKNATWNVTLDVDPTPRHNCYLDLHSILKIMSQSERQALLEDLSAWATTPTTARSDRRLMSSEELKSLASSALVEIGAHSSNHLALAGHPLDVQQNEISESKQKLEEITRKRVSSFAYPYGGRREADDQTIELVKESNFDLACANVFGIVTSKSDPYWLPRVIVRDWGGDEFARRLEQAFSG